MSANSILTAFPITSEEFRELDILFGDLVHYVAWQLKRKNSQNNLIEGIDDIEQELRISIIRAGSYYKRQVYIEECFVLAKSYVKDKFLKILLNELEELWNNRTRHGANKQKFGDYQQEMLEKIINKCSKHPIKNASLKIDNKFKTYCKSITWNCQKNLGKKITKELSIRSGLVSLSEHDFLCSDRTEKELTLIDE